MMFRQQRQRSRVPLVVMVLSLIGVLFPNEAHAQFTIDISANTTAIDGVTGSFDLQLNPGGLGTLPVTATITNFSTNGTGLSLNTTDGDVSGTLIPGPLTINNTLALNDLLENITFGTSLSFTVTLSGTGVTSPNPNLPGTSFALSLYDSNFNSLLTTDPAGTVVTANLNPDGSTSIQTFSSDNSGGASIVTATPEEIVATPAPSSIVLSVMGLGSMGLFAMMSRNRRSCRHILFSGTIR
jgi:hypothetical protein